MRLTHELLLDYPGLHGFDGLSHIRVYEQPGRLPVVIAGQLDDNPGTSITNAIEMLAGVIQRELFTDGREFQLIEHYPDTIDRRGEPQYTRVHFHHRGPAEQPGDPSHHAGSVLFIDGEETQTQLGSVINGDFRDPRWEPMEDIRALVATTVLTWPAGGYTAYAVAGDAGAARRSEIAVRAALARDQLLGRLIEP